MSSPDTTKAKTDAYLAALPADQRAALERLHAQVMRAAPRAEAHFGYGMPGFTYNGHPFLYLGAAKNHCALYGSNDATILAKLGAFRHSKGAIQFTPDAPLPAKLVKEIVESRIAANVARWGAPPMKKTTPAGTATKAKTTGTKPKAKATSTKAKATSTKTKAQATTAKSAKRPA